MIRPAQVLLLGMVLGYIPSAYGTLVDPVCDVNGDGMVDDLPADYEEPQQYGNLLNFYAVTMGNSPLHSPAPLGPFMLNTSVDVSYIPQLSCQEQAVYAGYKTEPTNKSPAFPRLRANMGLPFGFYVGLSGLPPVPAFGVKTSVVSMELGYGHTFNKRAEVGLRAYGLRGRVVGDLAGPLEGQPAVDDTYRDSMVSLEGMVGYRLSGAGVALTPYVGAGYMQVFPTLYVGEDNVEVPGANPDIARLRYRGPAGEVGAQLQAHGINAAAEVYVVPLNIDPGNPRLFVSPRVRIGWDFR